MAEKKIYFQTFFKNTDFSVKITRAANVRGGGGIDGLTVAQ